LWPSRRPQRSQNAAANPFAGASEDAAFGDVDSGSCHGTLRRITDGTIYRFGSLQGLVDLLRALVQNTYGGEENEEAH
jgi:hypothetical protein